MSNIKMQGRGGLLCLAADVTGPQPDDEILSISISDACGRIVYQGAYRPTRLTEWPAASEGCGIAPEDVAHAPALSDCLDEIQSLVDAASEVACYDAARTFGILRDAGVEVPQWKAVDTSDSYSRAVALLEGTGRRRRQPLESAVASVIGEAAGLRGSEALALATLEIQKWSDAVSLEVAQQSFIARWTVGPDIISDARATAVAFAQTRGMDE